jgi:hypothetical protein
LTLTNFGLPLKPSRVTSLAVAQLIDVSFSEVAVCEQEMNNKQQSAIYVRMDVFSIAKIIIHPE